MTFNTAKLLTDMVDFIIIVNKSGGAHLSNGDTITCIEQI